MDSFFCLGRVSRLSLTAALLGLVALMTAPASAVADDVKIGVIDSGRIFAEYQEAKDAEQLFQEEMRTWERELGDKEKEILDAQEKIRSQALLLSEDKLGEMQRELEQKIRDYEREKSDILDPNQGKAVLRNAELVKPINDRIMTVVEQIGAEQDFTMIIDRATVHLVYLAEGTDITDQVLKALSESNN